MLRTTDQLGDTVTHTHDAAGRLLARDYRTLANSPSGTIADSDTFTYDDASRLLTAVSGRYSNTVTLAYDAAGRQTSNSLIISGQTYVSTTQYDAAGRVSKLVYPDGSEVSRGYTARGQLANLAVDSTTIDTRTYDDGGRMTSSSYNNGVGETRAYNDDNTLASINYSGAAIGDLTYGWDANKNKTSESIGGVMSGYGFSAGYDAEDRLTSWDRADTSLDQSWNLSPVGDWNSITENSSVQNRTHGPVHEILTAASQAVEHDPKGNMTLIPPVLRPGNDPLKLKWNFDNKLRAADTGDDGIDDVFYRWDALGRRVGRDDGTNHTIYFQDGQQTLADYAAGTAASSPTYTYVYGSYIDEVVLRSGSGGARYYHRNQQYSIIALTDGGGSIVERYAYTAYGQVTFADTNGTMRFASASNNRYTYTGREWDGRLALYHFRARMYDAVTGRFCSRDPITYASGSYSLYQYVGGRVLSSLDPTGLVKIYNVDDSPACDVSDDSENPGSYWGIMVELSDQEKDNILRDGGGILVFTKEWKTEIVDCDGNRIHFQPSAIDWIGAGIIVVNGEVKMHHTNDPSGDLQYLQVTNNRMRPGSCKDYKSSSSYKVTVEVLTRTQASSLLHGDRFEPFNPDPRPNDPYGPFADEVGAGTTQRPWRMGGDRTGIPRATATAQFERNCCCGSKSCDASSDGTSGTKSRPQVSYYPRGGPNPWDF